MTYSKVLKTQWFLFCTDKKKSLESYVPFQPYCANRYPYILKTKPLNMNSVFRLQRCRPQGMLIKPPQQPSGIKAETESTFGETQPQDPLQRPITLKVRPSLSQSALWHFKGSQMYHSHTAAQAALQRLIWSEYSLTPINWQCLFSNSINLSLLSLSLSLSQLHALCALCRGYICVVGIQKYAELQVWQAE